MSSQPAPEEPRGFRRGDCVKSRRFGAGTVQLGNGATVIVRFEHGLEECLAAELVLVEPPEALLRRCGWQPPLEAVTRLQAEAIRSINDTWGVFARSQIDLLPPSAMGLPPGL